MKTEKKSENVPSRCSEVSESSTLRDGFDGTIDRMLFADANESFDLPDSVRKRTEETLASLPVRRKRKRNIRGICAGIAVAAAMLFVTVPNLFPGAARAMENLPVLGRLTKVVTVRRYVSEDPNHSYTVQVPKIESDVSESDAVEKINLDVSSWIEEMLMRFRAEAEEMGENSHSALWIDYDVMTDTDDWFTLRVTAWQGVGSSMTTYRFYHLDKRTGESAELSDLLIGEYPAAISAEIRRQMEERMRDDPDAIYWLDCEYPEWNFHEIGSDPNFYFDADGNLVIVFDKYDVAPGSMGCPEFAIARSVWGEFLK